MSNEMHVAASTRRPVVYTEDEQGYIVRSFADFIFYAANRHARINGGQFYLGGGYGG